MASSASTATAGKPSFNARVDSCKTPKSDINSLIHDYLITEGYPKAAAKFSKEANLKPEQLDASIYTRQQIAHFIHMGNIEDAILELNSYDHEILDRDPQLHFALLRLQLVELIRQSSGGDIKDALAFATEQLGPRAPTRPDFLRDLEQTLSLLFFTPDKLPQELKRLLSPDLRREVAEKVNKAILSQTGRRRDAAIIHLVRMRAWAENMARDAKKSLPDNISFDLQDRESFHENGHEPMITI